MLRLKYYLQWCSLISMLIACRLTLFCHFIVEQTKIYDILKSGKYFSCLNITKIRATDKLRICVFYSYCKSKNPIIFKTMVSRTLDIFLIRNCEYLPSVSISCLQSKRCTFIKMSSQVKPNSTIVKLCLPILDHPVIDYYNVY